MMTEFSYRLYKQGSEVLLAISDAEILGKIFSEGEIELSVSEDFYAGKTCSSKQAIDLIKSSTIVNAVGERIVDLLVSEEFIDKNRILSVSGVPHAQIIKLQ